MHGIGSASNHPIRSGNRVEGVTERERNYQTGGLGSGPEPLYDLQQGTYYPCLDLGLLLYILGLTALPFSQVCYEAPKSDKVL